MTPLLPESTSATVAGKVKRSRVPAPVGGVRARLGRGEFPQAIFNEKEKNAPQKKTKEVAIGGVTFPSLIEAYWHLKPKASYPMICKWIRDGMSPTEAFTRKPMRKGRPTSLPRPSHRGFTLKGVFYKNDADAYRRLKPPASYQTIQMRIREGMSRSRAFSLPAYPEIGDGIVYTITHKESRKIYVGETFTTLETCWKTHVYNACHRVGKEGAHPGSLQAAIRREGADAFEPAVVVRKKMKGDLRKRKNYTISKLKTKAPHGYNLTADG